MMKPAFQWLWIPVLLLAISCQESEEVRTRKERDRQMLPVIGLSFLEDDKLEEAEEAFRRYIDLSPKDAVGHANLALVLMRQNRLDEAEPVLKRALKLDPRNPDIRILQVRYLDMQGQQEAALQELQAMVASDGSNAMALYNLATALGRSSKRTGRELQQSLLRKLVDLVAPGNIVPRIDLVQSLLEDSRIADALLALEPLPKIFAEFPVQASSAFDRALDALHAGDLPAAREAVAVLKNFLNVTPQFQADLLQLKGPDADLAGLSVVTLSDLNRSYAESGEPVMERIRFIDMTRTLSLELTSGFNRSRSATEIRSGHLALGDVDGDGYPDVFYSGNTGQDSTVVRWLFRNQKGKKFQESVLPEGLPARGVEPGFGFADLDNDGYPDLWIRRNDGDLMLRNTGEGGLQHPETGLSDDLPGGNLLFWDAEPDGDLDILAFGGSSTRVFRNNGDGTWTESAASMGLDLPSLIARDGAFADMDDDGDLDLVLVTAQGPRLMTGLRHGRYQDATTASGLKGDGTLRKPLIADIDHDGYPDIFLLGSGSSALWINQGDGSLAPAPGPWLKSLNLMDPQDAVFTDVDNDGYEDLIVVGLPRSRDGKGIRLFQNDQQGGFREVAGLFPGTVAGGRQIDRADVDQDGDEDLVLIDPEGRPQLLVNEGGNLNHYLNLRLVGLREGNSKNNHFGIGARVEIRAGDLYQMKVVRDPQLHFGLGTHLKADVIRVTWTNGVAQNKFFPGSDELLLEMQNLKGSCAFLYLWNGEKFDFFKDAMWRSALGMPLGIMGANTAYAPPDASREYLKIPDGRMKDQAGQYVLQVTEELWEAAYVDQLELVAIDHPTNLDILVDERFTLPPYSDRYDLITTGSRHAPVTAVDDRGIDVLDRLKTRDHRYVDQLKPGKYQGLTRMHDLILDPGPGLPDKDPILVLSGWLFPGDASINVAMAQGGGERVQPPLLQVRDRKGEWVTVIPDMGFPMGKDKSVVVDLAGVFRSADHRVRIRTNMEIYWDEAYFTDRHTLSNPRAIRLKPVLADLHYRGFSTPYRKGGPRGPHWFDYNHVVTGQIWRDLTGTYTRYGEVTPLLASADDEYVILNSGDEMTVTFDARRLPAVLDGWTRDFLIYTDGWIKDGDLNTAHGQTVEPLPWHGMTTYPLSQGEHYPDDDRHRRFRETWLTREVDTRGFRGAMRQLPADARGSR